MKAVAVIIFTILSINQAAAKPKPCINCRQSKHYSSSYISSPVYTETFHASPVLSHEHVYAPAYERVYSAPAVHASLPAPHVIGDYTTHSVGPAHYELGDTHVHTTVQDRIDVKVPVTYNYHIETPVRHSTTVYRPATHYSSVHSAPVLSSSSWSSGYIPSAVSSIHGVHTADPWC